MLGLEKIDWATIFTYLFMLSLLAIYIWIMMYMTKIVNKK